MAKPMYCKDEVIFNKAGDELVIIDDNGETITFDIGDGPQSLTQAQFTDFIFANGWLYHN